MLTIALLTLALNPVLETTVAREHVVAVERHWRVNESGDELTFCQHIFWHRDPLCPHRLGAKAWRVVPTVCSEYDGWKCATSKGPPLSTRMVWDDQGVIRDVTAGFVFDTVSTNDPETDDRQCLPVEWREDLATPRTESALRQWAKERRSR